MGFSIGNVLSDLKLPNLNLGHLATTALEDGKKALGDVVKDSFTLSNKPGQTFATTMNLSIGGDHLTLPNPVGELGNALFAGADKLLGKVGVNVDFKTPLEELFHLPIQGGSVDVPTLKARIQEPVPQHAGCHERVGWRGRDQPQRPPRPRRPTRPPPPAPRGSAQVAAIPPSRGARLRTPPSPGPSAPPTRTSTGSSVQSPAST